MSTQLLFMADVKALMRLLDGQDGSNAVVSETVRADPRYLIVANALKNVPDF